MQTENSICYCAFQSAVGIYWHLIRRDEKQKMNEGSSSKNKGPIISVIVPVYNVEEYLKQCVDSILSQTLREIEIILIDDGSTDKCPLICDEYAESDERIYVIHQENKGVSAARNAGLRLAKGEYIAFIDSDDLVAPEYLSILLRHMGPSGMTACDYVYEWVPTVKKRTDAHPSQDYETVVMERAEAQMSILCGGKFDGHPFCKLFDRKLIEDNQIFFCEDISYAEDVLYVLQYLSHLTSEIVLIRVAPYYYQYRNQSATSQRIRRYNEMDPQIFSEIISVERSYNFIDHTPELLRCYDARQASAKKAVLAIMEVNGWKDLPQYKPYLHDVRANLFKALRYDKCSLGSKISTVLCAIHPRLYYWITMAWLYVCKHERKRE